MTGQTFRITGATVQREERAERRFTFEGLPPLVEYQRNRYRQDAVDVLLQVDRVTLVWINGDFRTAKVEGRRLKKDGKPGLHEGYRTYGKRWFVPGSEELEQVPEWLVDLVRLSPEPSLLEYQTQQDQAQRREAR